MHYEGFTQWFGLTERERERERTYFQRNNNHKNRDYVKPLAHASAIAAKTLNFKKINITNCAQAN